MYYDEGDGDEYYDDESSDDEMYEDSYEDDGLGDDIDLIDEGFDPAEFE